MKYPTIKELSQLIMAIKKDIKEDYRAFEFDDCPGIQLTIGHNPKTKEWSYQTGDNSYTGSAYHYPNWGVTGIYRNTNAREAAKELIEQLRELNY